jgi:Domain of unknown function (DUF1848)
VIISASRRTDIAAFYAPWFMNRVRAGFCTVPNPMNRKQISQISLAPADVDAIVFWTRDPRPLLPHLLELDARGFHYYFQFSLLGYPREIDPKSPSPIIALRAFRQLGERIGPERVIWRYDPVVFSDLTPPTYHEQQFAHLAHELRGCTRRCVVSVVDIYRKLQGRLQDLAGTPAAFVDVAPETLHQLLERLSAIAKTNGMEITSCAEFEDWSDWGIPPGKCVDGGLLNRLFGLSLSDKKDSRQREACGCVVSRDIGMYDTCLFGCTYCYATTSFVRAREQFAAHDPEAESIV